MVYVLTRLSGRRKVRLGTGNNSVPLINYRRRKILLV